MRHTVSKMDESTFLAYVFNITHFAMTLALAHILNHTFTPPYSHILYTIPTSLNNKSLMDGLNFRLSNMQYSSQQFQPVYNVYINDNARSCTQITEFICLDRIPAVCEFRKKYCLRWSLGGMRRTKD